MLHLDVSSFQSWCRAVGGTVATQRVANIGCLSAIQGFLRLQRCTHDLSVSPNHRFDGFAGNSACFIGGQQEPEPSVYQRASNFKKHLSCLGPLGIHRNPWWSDWDSTRQAAEDSMGMEQPKWYQADQSQAVSNQGVAEHTHNTSRSKNWKPRTIATISSFST